MHNLRILEEQGGYPAILGYWGPRDKHGSTVRRFDRLTAGRLTAGRLPTSSAAADYEGGQAPQARQTDHPVMRPG